ncbi:MAG: hypothetical protein QF752_17360 [Planctomycetota bacterium]|nr:hypothetical protein [Planctomycetota bacterium]
MTRYGDTQDSKVTLVDFGVDLLFRESTSRKARDFREVRDVSEDIRRSGGRRVDAFTYDSRNT